MSTPQLPLDPPRARRGFLQRHWKKLVGGVVGVVVLVLAASWFYVSVIKEDPPEEFGVQDVLDAVSTTSEPSSPTSAAGAGTTTGGEVSPTTAGPAVVTTVPAADNAGTTSAGGGTDVAAVDGVWNVTTASTLRYRVRESINGFDTEGVGQTNQITGTLTLDGTTATAADFTVDMTTFESDESRRDSAFDGRIMSVDEFPTSSFQLTSPIEFGAVPSAGETVTATATGDLTLRGVTKRVTFELTATLDNGKVGVLGSIPVLFSDYGIPNPSFGTITTEDNGLLEFVLVFERA